MVDYGKYKLSFNEAKSIVESWDHMDDIEYRGLLRDWSRYCVSDDGYAANYKPFRTEMIQAFRTSLESNGYRVDYALDLDVAIKLYELLNPDEGFTNIQANDDDIWRYISVKVMPDITFIRYPNLPEDIGYLRAAMPNLFYVTAIKTEAGSDRIKKKRFYSHTRRIWLKTLWWYIHLGWQGNAVDTYNVLKNNGTNIIGHFIERPGRGYRTELFRQMLFAYSQLPEQKDDIFRAAAKMNLAECVSIEPALTEGGEAEYAKKLFEDVMRARTSSNGFD